MSSVTTDESNYGSTLWRQPSVMSAASSNLTSSSGGAESFVSLDIPSFEKESGVADQLSFITHRSDHYYQLMDDLAIIDEIYQNFDDEVESEPYGNFFLKRPFYEKGPALLNMFFRKASGRCSKKRSTEKVCC